MNHDQSPSWSPMLPGHEIEFSNFLEFTDLHLDFPPFDAIVASGADVEQGDGGAETDIELGARSMGLEDGDDALGIHTPMPGFHDSRESLVDLGRQNQLDQQAYHHQQQYQYNRQVVVPPTPNSIDMHGLHAQHFSGVEGRGTYDISRKHQDQMLFTPLVSPAFEAPGHAIPGECFSPLTSPALRALDPGFQRSVYGAGRSDASDTSGLDMELNLAVNLSPALLKSKRKSSSTAKNPVRMIRRSPAMKAQRKNATITRKGVVEALEATHQSTRRQSPLANGVSLVLPQSQDSSEAESISPEDLSDILMPPPVVPRSGCAGQSPSLRAQDTQVECRKSAPATPASLMKIKKQDMIQHTAAPSISVPLSKPGLPVIDTQMSNTTLSASSSSIGAPLTAIFPSPYLGSATSPTSQGRLSKKRTSSTHASPALRPRISPSIKPLLPEGTSLTAETTTLLLASKSNYERILEGSSSSLGVSYPITLSENLTSKRTSHKLAEQGRRNRINTALQEIAALLPAGGTPGSEGEGTAAAAAAAVAVGGGSKANTVEMAIGYIKALQDELNDVKGRLRIAEEKLGGKDGGAVGSEGPEAEMATASS